MMLDEHRKAVNTEKCRGREHLTEKMGGTHPVDVEARLLARGGGAVDPDHRHLLHLLACVPTSSPL